MRAAVVSAPETVALEDREAPTVDPGQVLIAVDYVGLCGSDLSYFRRGANGSFVIKSPLVLGHEVTATVIAIDEGADTALTVGSRVAVHPLWPSPLPGERHLRAEFAEEPVSFLGSASTWPHTDGGLRELLSVRPERLRPLPAELPSIRATLAEPLSVVLHALDRVGPVDGARILVCGAGPIGLLALLALRRRGAAQLSISDLHERPLALARTLGADETLRVGNATPAADAFDLVIEATGAPASLEVAIASAAAGATIVQLGMLPRGGVSVDLAAVVTKELRLVGTHRFLGEIDEAIELLASAPECELIVTDVVPLEELERAFDLAGDALGSSKVLVAISERARQGRRD